MSQSAPKPQRGPSLLNFIVTLVIGLGGFAYLAFAVLARDALWFWPRFTATPTAITLRCYGKEVGIPNGSLEFTEITRLVNEQLSGDKQWQDITISDQTFEDYHTDPVMVILELYYADRVDVHTGTAMFLGIDSLLIPLVGRFSNESIILGANGPNFTGGRIKVQDIQPLKDYVNLSKLCMVK